MSRLFNIKVFEGWVNGTTVLYSDPAQNSQLGSADELRFQVNPDDVQGTAPVAFTMYYQCSNDALNWENNAAVLNAATVTAGASQFGNSSTTATNGGFGRVALSCEANKRVFARVWATGRST